MSDGQMTCDSIWEQVEKERVCMFATSGGQEGIEAKPMTPYCHRSEGVIWFVTDRNSHIVDENLGDDSASLIFQSPSNNFYATIGGTTTVVDSRDKITELWSSPMREFFDGPADPRIICLAFEPREASPTSARSDGFPRWLQGQSTNKTLILLTGRELNQQNQPM